MNGVGSYLVWIRKQALLKRDQKEPKGGNSRGASTNSRDSGRALIFPALGLVLNCSLAASSFLSSEDFYERRWSLLEINVLSHVHITERRVKYPGHRHQRIILLFFLLCIFLHLRGNIDVLPMYLSQKYDGSKKIEYENCIMFKLNDLWEIPQTTIIMLAWVILW